MVRPHLTFAVVNQNEIIAATAHFIEFDAVHVTVCPFAGEIVDQIAGGLVRLADGRPHQKTAGQALPDHHPVGIRPLLTVI